MTVVSCFLDTSRAQRDEEVNGREYHFVPRESMQKEIENGSFLEWGEVYKHKLTNNNNLYLLTYIYNYISSITISMAPELTPSIR